MSDTPETDAEKFFSDHHGYCVVFAEHAEDLERERDAFEKELAYVREALLDAMPNVHGSTKKLAELLVKERDEFVAELTKERDMANALARAGKRVADICEEKMLEAELANLKLERECNDLREIFPKILEALESGACASTCSVDFLREIPREVKLVRQRLERITVQEVLP